MDESVIFISHVDTDPVNGFFAISSVVHKSSKFDKEIEALWIFPFF